MAYANYMKVPSHRDAYNWAKRGVRNNPSVMFTAQLPDRFLDCWVDTYGKPHYKTRQRFTKVEEGV